MNHVPPILLVDGNSLGHANHHATKLTVGGLQVQAIFGFLKSLRSILNTKAIGYTPIILWDGDAQWRKDIYPDYKGNRKAMNPKQAEQKAAYKRQMPLLEHGLSTLGVMQIRSPLLEADDLAAHMVATTLKGRKTLMLSGDRDWLQLLNADTEWYDPIRDQHVHLDNFFEFTGYRTTRAFVQGKALQGDSSDNVPGVGGIGETGAPLFLATYGSVEEFFGRVDRKEPMKLTKAAINLGAPEGRKKYERNMQLMDLSQARKLEPGEAIIKRGKGDAAAFEAFCRRLAFASILRELPQFLHTFKVPQVTGPVVTG